MHNMQRALSSHARKALFLDLLGGIKPRRNSKFDSFPTRHFSTFSSTQALTIIATYTLDWGGRQLGPRTS